MQRDLTDEQIDLHLTEMLAKRDFPTAPVSYWLTPDEIRELFQRAALASAPAAEPVAWEYQNQHGKKFLSDTDPGKWHPHDQEGFRGFRALVYADSAFHPQAQVVELPPPQRYWWSPNRMQPWESSWSKNSGPHPDWNVTAYYSADEVRAILAARQEKAQPEEADRAPLWKQYSDEQTAKEVGQVRKAFEGKM